MEFSVKERLVAMSALPIKGNFQTLKELRAVREVFHITKAEEGEIDLRAENDTLVWNVEKVGPKEVALTPDSLKILRKGLEEMARKDEATEDHLALYEKLSDLEAVVVPHPAKE